MRNIIFFYFPTHKEYKTLPSNLINPFSKQGTLVRSRLATSFKFPKDHFGRVLGPKWAIETRSCLGVKIELRDLEAPKHCKTRVIETPL